MGASTGRDDDQDDLGVVVVELLVGERARHGEGEERPGAEDQGSPAGGAGMIGQQTMSENSLLNELTE